MEFSGPMLLSAGADVAAASLLVVGGVRLLARRERDEEAASQVGVEITDALGRDPRLRGAAILPVATIRLAAPPSVELMGRVPSASVGEVALDITRREVERLCPGMLVVDRLEIVPPAAARRPA